MIQTNFDTKDFNASNTSTGTAGNTTSCQGLVDVAGSVGQISSNKLKLNRQKSVGSFAAQRLTDAEIATVIRLPAIEGPKPKLKARPKARRAEIRRAVRVRTSKTGSGELVA